MRITACLSLVAAFLFASAPSVSGAISMQGAAADAGYNVGSTAIIRATVNGVPDTDRYKVFVQIGYAGAGTSGMTELNRVGGDEMGTEYEGRWPIPADAPTGLYTLTLQLVEPTRPGVAQTTSNVIQTRTAPGFFVYKKLLRITNVSLDKTFYAPGDRIRSEIGIENLTGHDIKGLRVEFSNENYPWISTFAGEANAADKMAVSPSLGLLVLRESFDLPAHGQATLPMQPAGTAAFLQGSQVAIMGAGGPARHAQVAPPEADRYTIAVWDHDRKNLLDMQFSPQVIVREPGRVLPKPYSRNFTHPYNSDIDFSKYREFYPPGQLTPMISLDESHTLYTPGDNFELKAKIRVPLPESGGLHFEIRDEQVREILGRNGAASVRTSSGAIDVPDAWSIPASIKPGVYTVVAAAGSPPSTGVGVAASMELAINKLPTSLMVFCPHEDDEHPWAGLMRAMVEAGRPVRVVFYTGGDVGECERYFDGHPCDPVRAREFGTVRMEESTEALEHIGVKRDQDIFLGLPDGGSGEIWFRHLQATNPFLSIYLAVDHAPYEHLFEPNLPYARDAVLDAVKRAITEFRPAMIAVSHPDERHVDHRTANWFTLKACQELLREGRIDPGTVVLADQAYGSGGFKAAPYQYEKYVVYLSGEAAALKQEMGWLYQSQDGNLEEGSKRTYGELPRQELHYRITDWQQHEGWNE